MKPSHAWNRSFIATSALCLALAPALRAQTAQPADAAAVDTGDETIVLSPFVVDASTDENGYRANSTLAGTRVRTDLKDVASAISVVTQQFLKDTGAKNSADLLVYTPSTEVAGLRGNFSGVAQNPIYQENTISSTTRVRGLDTADNTRDYFLTDIPWDGFNVGRVDLQRGPNSILFGIGSPAGIINTSVNDAGFKTTRNFENQLDQYGSIRNSIDLNQVLVPNVLAIRFAAVQDNRLFEQEPAFNDTTRYYAALRFDPKLFAEGNHTSIKVKVEDGKVRSNNPRTIPPGDSITRWFTTGADAYGNPGYNKIIINQFNPAQVTPWGTFPGGKGGTLANGLGVSNQARSYWPDVINYYEATPTDRNNVTNPQRPGGTPIRTITAGVNIMPYGSFGTLGGGVNNAFLPLGIPMNTAYYPQVGRQAGFPGYTGNNQQPSIPGAIYYANSVLMDPTIFNFYKLLGDGPNKHEWQDWRALNVALEQTFFGDRLGLQLAFDHQDFTSGAEQWMAGENYNINVDINATYADGSANPNAGRPYFGTGESAPGLNFQQNTVRNTTRFTPTYEFRPEDLISNEKLAKIVGKQVFTAVLEHSTVKTQRTGWARFATTADYITSNSLNANAANTLNSNRSFEWIAYIGPDMRNRTTAAGLNLEPINFKISPPAEQNTINFNSRWRQNPIVGTAGYVDPAAPYSYTNYVTGAAVTTTQVDNPANYIGWSQQQIKWLKSDNPADFPNLVNESTRTRYRDMSQGYTWQGYLLGGDLVPTVGWRKDIVTNYQTNAVTDQNTGFTSTSYPDDLTSRTDVRGESKSWGGVYHLPQALTSKLPWGTTISVFYDRSSNFKADAQRLDLNGLHIPNATGQTKEYGVTITTLDDKLTLKVNKFRTRVANATLGSTEGNSIGGMGQNGYFLADGAIWGYGWATLLQQGLSGVAGLDNSWDYAGGDGLPRSTPEEILAYDNYNHRGGTFGTHTYIGGDAIVNAWLHAPFAPTFFSSYNLSPAIDPSIGTRTGRLADSYYAGGVPTANFLVGGGSSFGNHQTTVDNLSKGYEVELTYQPIKNWNITVNYAKIDAMHERIDPVSSAFIGSMTAFYNGPGGQLRQWGNGDGNQIQNAWNSNIVAPYTVLLNGLGHAAPEVSPWRVNLVTTYSFDRGALKGSFIGGAFRSEAGRIIGYRFNPNFVNVNSTDPDYANVAAVTQGGLDVNQPFKGENDTHFDMWVGYSRKITKDINWRVQLNVRSLFEENKLVAGRVNPDGSVALARIQQGMNLQLTNSFDF